MQVSISAMRILLSMLLLCTASQTNGCGTGPIRLVDQRGREVEGRSGVVQLCIGGIWHTACRFDGWNKVSANTVCRELGYLGYGADTNGYYYYYHYKTDENLPINGSVDRDIKIECQGNEIRVIDCIIQPPNNTIGCSYQSYANVTCLQGCTNREIRLVNGSTNREGRVEVCVDGRWGTVCGEGWGDTEAGLVCARLGFPGQGAQVEQFGESSNRPIYNLSCSSPESDSPDCTVTPAPDSCDHSMDLGVRCLSHQEVTSSSSDNSSTALGAVTNNSSEVLGAVTGLLMVVVIVLAIGWILTCLIMKKRQSRSKDHIISTDDNLHQMDNPVYNQTVPHTATNSSSLEPTYAQVDQPEDNGYDVVNNTAGLTLRHPHGTNVPSSDQNYNVISDMEASNSAQPAITPQEYEIPQN